MSPQRATSKSARGLAHSGTLRAARTPPEFASASWSAAALRRFVTPSATSGKWQGNVWQGNGGTDLIPLSIIPLPNCFCPAFRQQQRQGQGNEGQGNKTNALSAIPLTSTAVPPRLRSTGWQGNVWQGNGEKLETPYVVTDHEQLVRSRSAPLVFIRADPCPSVVKLPRLT